MRATARAGRRSALSRKRRSIWLVMTRAQARALLATMHTGIKRGAGDGGGYQMADRDICLNGGLFHRCTDCIISITRSVY